MKRSYALAWLMILAVSCAAAAWVTFGAASLRRREFGVPPIPEASRSETRFLAVLLPRITDDKSRYSMSAAQLAEFLSGLKRAGDVPIGLDDVAEFYARGRRLPPHAVLLAFSGDNPRGMELADAALKALRLRGAAFISGTSSSSDEQQRRRLSRHAVKQLRLSGAWDVGLVSAEDPPAVPEAGTIRALLDDDGRRPPPKRPELYALRFAASEMGLNDDGDDPRALRVLALKADRAPAENLRVVGKAWPRENVLADGFEDDGLGADWITGWGVVSRGRRRLVLIPTPRQSGAGVFLRGTEKWRDFSLEFELKRYQKEFWAYARYKEDGGFVRVGARGGYWYVEQKIGPKSLPTQLARAPIPEGGLPARVRFVLKGRTAVAYVNGRMLFGRFLRVHPSVGQGRVLFGVYDARSRSAMAVLTSVRAAPLGEVWLAPRPESGGGFDEERLEGLREEAVAARTLSPRWVAVSAEGGVTVAESQGTLVRSLAGFYGCRLVPMADAEALGAAALSDPASAGRLSDALLDAARRLDAGGLNLRLTGGEAGRPETIAFLAGLRAAFRARKAELWVTVDGPGPVDPALVRSVDGVPPPVGQEKAGSGGPGVRGGSSGGAAGAGKDGADAPAVDAADGEPGAVGDCLHPMKIASIAAVLLTLAFGRAAAAPYEEGVQLLMAKRYPEAITKLELAAHADPGAPDVLMNLAWAYWHDKRVDDAWRVGSTLVKLDPENRVFLTFLANMNIEKKDYRAAAELASRALALLPEDRDASLALAKAWFLDGKQPEAIALLDKLVARSPKDPAAVYRRAVFWSDMGRKTEALAALEALLAGDPANAAYRRSRAKVLSELGRQDEAIKEWKALTHRETDTQSLLNLGWAYWREKKYDDARKIADELVKLEPENGVFLTFLANMEIEKEDYHGAAETAERVLRRLPDDRDATMALAKARFLEGRQKEALALLDAFIARFPNDSGALYRRAVFRSEAGRKAEALSALDALLAADPSNPALRRSRAKVLSDLGRQEEAVSEWKALTSQETDTQSLMNLGWAYWRQKNIDAAWQIANTLLKLDGQNPAFLRFMANMEIERMDYPEALRHAQAALTLAPGDRDAEMILAKALFRMQRVKDAKSILQQLVAQFPDNEAVQYRWAEFLGRTGQYDQSVFYFDRLIKADPANEVYRLDRAMALYGRGDFDAAIAEWRGLASRKEPNIAALKALRDDAFNRRDWDAAVAWQQKVIADSPSDPLGWVKLYKMYIEMKQVPQALWAAEHGIAADPVSINAYYNKSEALVQSKDWRAAQAAYEEVVSRNPNSLMAYDGLSYMEDALGDHRAAMKNVERIETLTAPFPPPFQELHRASLLASMGHYARALEVLTRLENGQTPIPILLYHGISVNDRTDSIPQESFRRQMQALKNAGYQPMTVSELDLVFRGMASLPRKPILITFDDGRTDTFENADPVLKEMGFRATMFVHVSKLRKPYFHASPEDIQRWQDTGRWEMQAHGYEAHDPMPLDSFGRKGHFLPNRMWLASADRLESIEEYRARVASEYRKAKEGVEAIVPGHEVVAFAYPYGDYGQSDYSNTPDAAPINRTLVRKTFRLAFVQGQHGVNTLSSNPLDLERFEVKRYMTPEQLMSHLALNDPRVQARLLEAQLYVQADQLGRAYEVYDEMTAKGLDDSRLWADMGVAYQKGGDIGYAQNLFTRAAAQETDTEGEGALEDQTLIAQAAHAAAPNASAEVQEFTDSDTNAILKEIVRGGGAVKSLRIGGWVGHGDYWSDINPALSMPHVHSEEGGVQLDWSRDGKWALDGLYDRRVFMNGVTGFSDNYSVAAGYQLVPSLKLAARDGESNVETALAIRDGIRYHSDGAGLTWDPYLSWKANADYDQERYDDSNREQDLRLRLTKRFSSQVAFGVAYFNGDSKQNREPVYYTPRALNQYTGVLTLTQIVGEINKRTGLAPAEGQVQYEGGYGYQTAGSSVVNSAKLLLTLRPFDPLALTIDAEYAQSPLYISRTLDAALKVSF